MRRGWSVLAIVVVVWAGAGAGACGKSKSSGLPPATEWSATSVAPGVAMDETAADNDPHAGLDMSGAQLPNGDPDDEGGGPTPSNPHAGLAGGADMAQQLNLPPPNPNRTIDPTHRISGVIKVAAAVAGKVGDVKPVFLAVKRPDASGNPAGAPIAVQKLTWTPGKDLTFEITEQDVMLGINDVLSGDVVVTAHYDNDGDAMTKTSGDVLGMARVTVPADKVVVTLDTPVP
jgi:hypothetical protein